MLPARCLGNTDITVKCGEQNINTDDGQDAPLRCILAGEWISVGQKRCRDQIGFFRGIFIALQGLRKAAFLAKHRILPFPFIEKFYHKRLKIKFLIECINGSYIASFSYVNFIIIFYTKSGLIFSIEKHAIKKVLIYF